MIGEKKPTIAVTEKLKMVKNIYGNELSGTPVAYCFYKHHRGYLTVKNLKKHECLRKQCPCLKKLPSPYWEKREAVKQKRRERKNGKVWGEDSHE